MTDAFPTFTWVSFKNVRLSGGGLRTVCCSEAHAPSFHCSGPETRFLLRKSGSCSEAKILTRSVPLGQIMRTTVRMLSSTNTLVDILIAALSAGRRRQDEETVIKLAAGRWRRRHYRVWF